MVVRSPGAMVGGGVGVWSKTVPAGSTVGPALEEDGGGGGETGEGKEGEREEEGRGGEDEENEEENEEEEAEDGEAEVETADGMQENMRELERRMQAEETTAAAHSFLAPVASSEGNGSSKTWKDILLSVKAASQPGAPVPGSELPAASGSVGIVGAQRGHGPTDAGKQEGAGAAALAAVAARVVAGMHGSREEGVGGAAGKAVGAIGAGPAEGCRPEGWKRARSVATGAVATGWSGSVQEQWGVGERRVDRHVADVPEGGGQGNEEGQCVNGSAATGEDGGVMKAGAVDGAVGSEEARGGVAFGSSAAVVEGGGEEWGGQSPMRELLGALESPTRWAHLCAKMDCQRQLYEAQDDSRATQLSEMPDEFIIQILSHLTDPLDWAACLVLSRRFAALSCLALQTLYLLPNRLLPKPLLARYLACYPNLAALYLPWNSLEVEGDDVFEMIVRLGLELQALHIDVFPGYNERTYARTPAGLSTLFTSLPSLRSLSLCTGRFVRTLPTSISRLWRLEELLIMNQSSKLGLRSLPPALGQLSNLRRLVLDSCLQLATLPEEIGQLTGLEELELLSLDCLRHLPESIGQLQRLKWFKMCWCMSVRSLPESIGQLKELEEIVINMAASATWLGTLKELPQSFGQLYSLRFLKIVGCPLMLDLPESFGQLYQLEEFVFDNKGFSEESEACGLLSLPDSFEQLTSLVRLELRNCFALTSLPESLGQLPYLYSLKLIGCYSLSALPESLGSSGSLQLLLVDNKVDDDEEEEEEDGDGDDDGSSIVSHSTAMDMGMGMSMNGTDGTTASDDGGSNGRNGDADDEEDDDDDDDDGPSGLLSLPSSMGAMCNLRQLVLRANVSLVSLPPSLFSLHLLESLVLDFTETRTQFSDHSLGPPSPLGSKSASLASLSSLPASSSMTGMDTGSGADGGLGFNTSMTLILPADMPAKPAKPAKPAGIAELPEAIAQLVNLRRLDLIGCSNLSELPESLGSLQFLQRLVVAFCPAIQSLPSGIGQLKYLQTFVVQNCPSLCHLPDSLTALAGLPELCIDEKSVGVKIPDHLLRLPGFRRDSCFFEDRLFVDLIE
ncbi:hypothetical protein CLOM_g21543 [Closterium sp. NIES-68]|nr:hypothetical protein CLOM_g21543 [Closterium sp. NIES-68]